jgi:RNA polymerase sigma-70 factor, ECF subfamily
LFDRETAESREGCAGAFLRPFREQDVFRIAMSSTTVNARELRALLVPFISKRVALQDVEDVLQTVFVRIQRGLADLRDSDKLVAWTYQVARNVIIDHVRHAAIRQHDTLERVRSAAAPVPDDEDSAVSELAIILGHFIAMLPEPYRDALRLTELHGVTQAEAARRAGLSVPGMKSRVQRARTQLRELLEACCDIELDTRGSIIDVEPRNRPAELPDCCDRKPASSALTAAIATVHPQRSTPVSRSMTNEPSSKSETSNQQTTPADTTSGCCGGPAPTGSAACCVEDATAKAAGETGCGCGPKAASVAKRCC